MSQSKKAFIACLSAILALVVISGCLPGKQNPVSFNCAPLSKLQSMLPGAKKSGQTSTASGTATGPTRPHPPVRTGDITTGPKAQVASQSIDSSGGTIAVSKPGDPLDGLVIDVPPQAFSGGRTFKVSSAPITKQTFGPDINPASPMISVDNGGGYSDELMYVRVPLKVPDGSFAMGFLYDEKTKQLEGMPLVGKDAESVTVATRHFSNFFISMIENALLKKDIDSGFRPGIDDWQFTNYGSYIAAGGHCEGQSLSAMWYYCTQPDGNGACLYNRYDNNGDKPATPNIWQDDSLGYRFASMVQTEKHAQFTDAFWDNLAGVDWQLVNNKWQIKHIPGIGDENILNLFAYSIRATNEPQEVGIYSNAGGGHAMIVYKIVGNALYIADPNYPGNTDRKIIYYSGEGKFKPYNSGSNKKEIEAGNGKSYENIQYLAKSTVVPWDKIALHWTSFKNKTIGNDKFPQYILNVVDEQGGTTPLTDGYIAKTKKVIVRPASNNHGILYFRDGAELPYDNNGAVELNAGDNQLGIWIMGKVGNDWQYIDFKYFNVKFDDGKCKTPPPASVLAKLQKSTKFAFAINNVPCTVDASGSLNKWVPGFVKSRSFVVPYNYNYFEWKDPAIITWSGNTFSYTGVDKYSDKLTGYVCYTGNKVLLSFDYEVHYSDPRNSYKVSAKDIPLNDPDDRGEKLGARNIKPGIWQYNITGTKGVNGYMTKLEWAGHEERKMGDQVRTWDFKMTEWHVPDSISPNLWLYE
jgi:hypothetical protein